MSVLAVAFYGEGNTDYVFLKRIIQRTLEKMLPHIEILPLTDIHANGETQQDKMLAAAREAHGYGLLVFHLDADAPDTKRARAERFDPAYAYTVQHRDEVIREIVPVIPVRITEAWMLVDFDAFREITRTKASQQDAKFPGKPHEVESVQNPKSVIQQAVNQAATSRRKRILLKDIYAPLAEQIDLAELEKVPAYRSFRDELLHVLKETDALRYLWTENDS
jgi:hypothetical protein